MYRQTVEGAIIPWRGRPKKPTPKQCCLITLIAPRNKLKSWRSVKGVTLNSLGWARQHQRPAVRQWRYSMYRVQSRFCPRFTDGRRHCWRRSERYTRAKILESDSFLVCGGITHDDLVFF